MRRTPSPGSLRDIAAASLRLSEQREQTHSKWSVATFKEIISESSKHLELGDGIARPLSCESAHTFIGLHVKLVDERTVYSANGKTL
jgi:hypothetical protein